MDKHKAILDLQETLSDSRMYTMQYASVVVQQLAYNNCENMAEWDIILSCAEQMFEKAYEAREAIRKMKELESDEKETTSDIRK